MLEAANVPERMKPIHEQQTLLAAALTAERSDQRNQTESETNHIRIEPQTRVRN